MLYLLTGDDILYKNKFIENLKKEYVNYAYKSYYVNKNNELPSIIDDSSLFLNTTSFFYEKKIVKINCLEDSFIEILIDKLLLFCDDNNIVILSIESIKQSIIKKYSNVKNITIYTSNNFKNKLEVNKYITDTLDSNNIKFKTNKDLNLLCDVILTSSKLSTNNFDKQIIESELNKLIDYNLKSPLTFESIKKLYREDFDGNFFQLVDQIFIKNSISDVIDYFEKYCTNFNSDEVNSFFNIIRYTIKEYIKYINGKETKKIYLFKKTKTKILNPEILLCELGDMMLEYRLSKNLNLEKINLLLIKHIYFI